MPPDRKAELVSRHADLTKRKEALKEARQEFIWEKTGELSTEHPDVGGTFKTSSVRKGYEPTIYRDTDDEARRQAIVDIFEAVRSSPEYNEFDDELANVEAELDTLWDLIGEIVINPEAFKKDNIGTIWTLFGTDVPKHRVAQAVGCHVQYPGRLTYNPETESADYKEHVQKRKNNQVRSDQRQRILDRDGRACVRSGTPESDVEKLIVHHIIPVNDDGPAVDENLASLCPKCHSKAHTGRGAGVVFYESQAEFWEWVRAGSRGFDPHRQQSTFENFQ